MKIILFMAGLLGLLLVVLLIIFGIRWTCQKLMKVLMVIWSVSVGIFFLSVVVAGTVVLNPFWWAWLFLHDTLFPSTEQLLIIDVVAVLLVAVATRDPWLLFPWKIGSTLEMITDTERAIATIVVGMWIQVILWTLVLIYSYSA